jgi:hypothetical protein
MMTPEPTIVSKRRVGLILLIFIAWIDTTAGDTRSNSTASGSTQGCAAVARGDRSSSATARTSPRVT